MPTTISTTTIRPRAHDRKRIKHSTSIPIQDSHRRSSFRYSSINNSGTSLNSILEVDHHDRREEEEEEATTTCTSTITSSSRLSRSLSTPLPVIVTQSSPDIAHTDFWHSTRTMKKAQTYTSLSGLLDIVSMAIDDDDDYDEEEEIDEDFDNDNKKMDVDDDDDDDIHNTVSVTSSIRDSSIRSFSSSIGSSSSSQEEADGDEYFFFEDDDNENENENENCEWGLQF